jgi:hypothetical protein
MEAASTSETAVNFYQTTQHNNPEDSHLHTCHHENLKSHNGMTVSFDKSKAMEFRERDSITSKIVISKTECKSVSSVTLDVHCHKKGK